MAVSRLVVPMRPATGSAPSSSTSSKAAAGTGEEIALRSVARSARLLRRLARSDCENKRPCFCLFFSSSSSDSVKGTIGIATGGATGGAARGAASGGSRAGNGRRGIVLPRAVTVSGRSATGGGRSRAGLELARLHHRSDLVGSEFDVGALGLAFRPGRSRAFGTPGGQRG